MSTTRAVQIKNFPETWIRWNAGGTLCWVCTTAGTPGAWKAVAIAA